MLRLEGGVKVGREYEGREGVLRRDGMLRQGRGVKMGRGMKVGKGLLR